jgi:hypothetical protein
MRAFFAGLIVITASFFAISAAIDWRDSERVRAMLDGAVSAFLAALAATVMVL